jgi:DUF4097 and DUF4098 domain-containing protein YvlB
MRSGAILRIVIWSFVAIFLITMFVTFVIFDNYENGFIFHIGEGEKVKEAKKTVMPAEDIDILNIKWTYGTVNIIPYDGSDIVITEKVSGNVYEDELFNIDQEGSTLNLIQENSFSFLNIFNWGFKSITREIKVPSKTYKEIITNHTSGKLEMDNINVDELNCKMTSGSLKATNLIINDLTTNITSGTIDIDGAVSNIDIKETSGITNVETSVVPSKLKVNITSGGVTVSIPDNSGFIVGKHITSGSFNSEFDLDEFDRYKDGSLEYSVRITSGFVRLNKN